jgi:hypothetical protein
MKTLRRPNGEERTDVWPHQLLDMVPGTSYYYLTTFGVVCAARARVGLTTDGPYERSQKVLVSKRASDNTFTWTLV